MLFRYNLQPTRKEVWSLGGRKARPRPLAIITLIGPAGVVSEYALLDSGADDTVFPEWMAQKVGLDLSQAPVGEASGVGSGPHTVRYAEVTLRLTDGREYRQWPARVGFTAARLGRPLLGFAGVLQFFTASFRGEQEQIELAVNGLYPGT